MKFDEATRTMLTRICVMFGSELASERAAAAAKADEFLRAAGLTWMAVLDLAGAAISSRTPDTAWASAPGVDGKPVFTCRHHGVNLRVRQAPQHYDDPVRWTVVVCGKRLREVNGDLRYFATLQAALAAATVDAEIMAEARAWAIVAGEPSPPCSPG
jgi:hypothetical protein